jgi:hypothetical protein
MKRCARARQARSHPAYVLWALNRGWLPSSDRGAASLHWNPLHRRHLTKRPSICGRLNLLRQSSPESAGLDLPLSIAAPYPSLLAITGAGLAFLPFAPQIAIEPDLALALFVAIDRNEVGRCALSDQVGVRRYAHLRPLTLDADRDPGRHDGI